ncbi:MAG: gnnA [Deltaproteobacteria bacterium]|jgi:predicted dehydrogenase|nr:gnnA [Deltaproteobacteria bacterium]
MTAVLRAAVIGVGHLGAFHAEKYASMRDVELVAVVDADAARAETIATQHRTGMLTDYRQLFGRVDCVSLAVPSPLHFPLAYDCLAHGIDVLVEKPLATSVAEGRGLVEAADRHARILQVGHLERFNPAIRALAGVVTQPRFIECHRLAPFVDRGTDVDVILDLMIHDLDVILSLVQADVQSAEAVGVPVLSETVDIANARLRFTNGCIANITASRVALKRERKIRLFQSDTYVSVDYGEKHVRVIRRVLADGSPSIEVEEHALGEGDALFDEIEHFVTAVRTRQCPLVDGRTALRALEVAEMIRGRLETG